ncbi:type III secretion system export apparatus subunit SctT [Citrobacter freundii]|nr:type III secretion system export apparatus subunit SctT [Citrobacter freundii]
MDLIAYYHQYAPVLFISLLRPLGIFVVMPVLTSRNLSGALIRNALMLAIMLPLFPAIAALPYFAAPLKVDSNFLLTLGSELLIGGIIGFVAAIPFWAIGSAGFLLDTLRGSSMGSIFNPMLGESSSLLSNLLTQMLTALFFMSGGMNQLLTALYASYAVVPPGSHFFPGMSMLSFLRQQWELLSALMLAFSLPGMAVMLLTDAGMGLLNRSAQQLNVFFLAMSLKSILALLILMLTLGVVFEKYRQVAHSALIALMQQWR